LPDEVEPILNEGYGIAYTKYFDGNDIEIPNKTEINVFGHSLI